MKSIVKPTLKAANPSHSALIVRTGVKSGAITGNHNESGMKVRTRVKSGAITGNHNEQLVRG